MRCNKSLLLTITALWIGILNQNINAETMDPETAAKQGLVEVEIPVVSPAKENGTYILLPYGQRRSEWGSIIGVGYSMFDPINYEPDGVDPSVQTFDQIYGGADVPLIELEVKIKRNFEYLSMGIDFGAGYYNNKGTLTQGTTTVDYELSIIPIRLGLYLGFDNIAFTEPYIVPYVTGGGYLISYKENYAAISFNGNTDISMYAAAGVMMQIDWIEKKTARTGYEDSGIQSSFLFVEGRKFFTSDTGQDPDFETDVHLNAGVQVEF